MLPSALPSGLGLLLVQMAAKLRGGRVIGVTSAQPKSRLYLHNQNQYGAAHSLAKSCVYPKYKGFSSMDTFGSNLR